MESQEPQDGGQGHGGQGRGERLHIFINRRKFEESDGVRASMTAGEIAALVQVPADNAVVRRDNGPDRDEIPINQPLTIKNGQHYLVTRRTVEGGYDS